MPTCGWCAAYIMDLVSCMITALPLHYSFPGTASLPKILLPRCDSCSMIHPQQEIMATGVLMSLCIDMLTPVYVFGGPPGFTTNDAYHIIHLDVEHYYMLHAIKMSISCLILT
jgi:hypothetical protein